MNIATFLIAHSRVVTLINVLIMVGGISGLSFFPVERPSRRH